MKRLFIMLLVVMMILSLAACGKSRVDDSQPADSSVSGSETTDETTGKKIGVSVMIMENPYFIAVVKGLQHAADELGYELVVVDAKYDVAKQVSDVENFINQGLDGMIIMPIDESAMLPLVDKAKEKGMLVMAESQPVSNAHIIYTIDEYQYGVAIGANAAEWINEKLGGEAEVLLISQDNVETIVSRGDGIQETIEKLCPNAKIVARQAGDTAEKGMEVAENILQQYPNLKVITGNNDSGALGAYEAVMSRGKGSGDFYIGGADATDEAIAKMQEEDSVYRATVANYPMKVGYECIYMLDGYFKNGFPEKTETFLMGTAPVWQKDVLDGTYSPESLESLTYEPLTPAS